MLYPTSNPGQNLFSPGSAQLGFIFPKRVGRYWLALTSVEETHSVLLGDGFGGAGRPFLRSNRERIKWS